MKFRSRLSICNIAFIKFFYLPTSSLFLTEEYTKNLFGGLKRLFPVLFTELLHTLRVLLPVNLY